MKISVELSDTQEQQLLDAAQRLNVTPEELAQAAVRDLLAREEADFDKAAKYILEKNRELYRRLSQCAFLRLQALRGGALSVVLPYAN